MKQVRKWDVLFNVEELILNNCTKVFSIKKGTNKYYAKLIKKFRSFGLINTTKHPRSNNSGANSSMEKKITTTNETTK